MRPDENQPATNETPASKTGEERIQAQAQSAMEPVDAGTGSLPDLRKASEELKTKIAEAKRRNDLPLDSALGNPGWEQSAADGHVDIPDKDDD